MLMMRSRDLLVSSSTSDRRLRDMQDMMTQIKTKNEDNTMKLRTKIEEETLRSESLEEQMKTNAKYDF